MHCRELEIFGNVRRRACGRNRVCHWDAVCSARCVGYRQVPWWFNRQYTGSKGLPRQWECSSATMSPGFPHCVLYAAATSDAPGEVAYQAIGIAGALCVIVAGWTTANSTLSGLRGTEIRLTVNFIYGYCCSILSGLQSKR
jgi:hypothetical protein